MAITGIFGFGTLSLLGDGPDNEVEVSRNAAGQILANGGAVAILGGTPTVANTALIQAFGLGGNDRITLNEASGALPRANLFGGDGDDVVDGQQGNDVAFLGAGDDVLQWDPGDGNDRVEGQAGFDTMLFNGANVGETMTISANGGRALFVRNVASVTMDLDDVEAIDFAALGGADTIVVDDPAGTDVTEIRIDLRAFGGAGDGQVDTIVVNATTGDDVVLVAGDAGGVVVLGLAARIEIIGMEAIDLLVINTLGGDDVVGASALAAVLQLTANGGDDDDVLVGGAGADLLLGGAGDDVLIGGLGLDILDGGTGDNIVIQ